MAAVVEDVAVPLRMVAPFGVGVLEEVGAVEKGKAVGIAWEVGGDPVEDDADALLVHVVHEGHEVLGGAVTGGGGEKPYHLIAPGAVEGVLHDGQKLHVGLAQVFDVARELLGELPVAQKAVPLLRDPPPGAGVDLVDGPGGLQGVVAVALRHPAPVLPWVAQVPDHRGGLGGLLPAEGEGIPLVHLVAAVAGDDAVFVKRPVAEARHKSLPDPRAVLPDPQGVAFGVPAVEVPHHRDPLGIGGPHGKEHPRLSPRIQDVGAKLLVEPKMGPLLEEVDVVVGEEADVVPDVHASSILSNLPCMRATIRAM